MSASRPPQPVSSVIDIVRPVFVGNLPTMNQDQYPTLGTWWVQVRDAQDEIIMRVYGESVEQVRARAHMIADAINAAS